MVTSLLPKPPVWHCIVMLSAIALPIVESRTLLLLLNFLLLNSLNFFSYSIIGGFIYPGCNYFFHSCIICSSQNYMEYPWTSCSRFNISVRMELVINYLFTAVFTSANAMMRFNLLLASTLIVCSKAMSTPTLEKWFGDLLTENTPSISIFLNGSSMLRSS